MPSFAYQNPPEIHWGEGVLEERLGSLALRLGLERVVLVTSRSVLAGPGPDAVRAALGDRLVGTFSGVSAHAPIEQVKALADELRARVAGAVVSLGGGSAIDAAKAASWFYASGSVPHLAVPTTLSAAELSAAAGFTDRGEKTGVGSSRLLARAVILDGALATHTPIDLWLTTGARAIDHAVETITGRAGPLPEVLAAEALRRLPGALSAARADPSSAAARTAGFLGAWLGYVAPPIASRGPSHVLGKAVGARCGIPHGVTSCVLLPRVLRLTAGRDPEADAAVAAALSAPTAAEGVERVFAGLGLPRSFAPWSPTAAALDAAAEAAAGAVGVPAETLRNLLAEAS